MESISSLRWHARLKQITTFVFDVDGVFTDGTLLVGAHDVQREFSVRDGYAVQMALKNGFRVAVISGGKQESIRTRLSGLGIPDVFLSVGTAQKPEVMAKYLAQYALQAEEVLYMGDDLPDYLVMKQFPVLSACPADAVAEVKEESHYISPKKGGDEAVRDVIEMVLKAQNKWMKVF